MEFAWNTQKNKLTDVKGKEKEQNRHGKVKNEDIDFNKTHLNFDFVSSDLNLYQRVKNRVEEVRHVSRVQKNSVVMYSNVVTVPKETNKVWGIEKSREYLKEVYHYFCNEFGKENVVSAKVHLDETTPHMHLHFVPINEEGKLQARKVMTPGRINKIHSEAPKFLQARGFEVVRGKGVTHKDNINDIHKYKIEKLKEDVSILEKQRNHMLEGIKSVSNIDKIKDIDVKIKKGLRGPEKVSIDVKDYEYLMDTLKNLREGLISSKFENIELRKEVLNLKEQEDNIFNIKEDYHNRLNTLFNREIEFNKRDKELSKKEKSNSDFKLELLRKSNELIQESNRLKFEKEKYKERVYKELEEKYIELEHEIDIYKSSFEYLKSTNKYKDRKISLLERNSKIDSSAINMYIAKYGNDLMDTMLQEKDFNIDNDNTFIKFINFDREEIKHNDTYQLHIARELVSLLAEKYGEIEFEYELYKDSPNNLIHRDNLVLSKGSSFKVELNKQVNNSNSYFIRHKFNKDNEKKKKNKFKDMSL